MSQPYPIMLDMQGKKAVVIGGGRIATHKIKCLKEAGANVTVVSPTASADVEQWANAKELLWKRRNFQTSDLTHAFLVIAATNDETVNQAVAQATASSSLLCVVDAPETGNFTVPARMTRGKLTIAVSTTGASPGVAKQITKDLAATYDAQFAAYLDFLAQARQTVKETIQQEAKRKEILTRLLDKEFQQQSRQEQERLFQVWCKEGDGAHE
ncbi:siroheme synthase [Fictibacillus macauensis ZFHKF-1]|uniref:precorrin-2 dehydrogenase n=1 Tax=Fictibacillus macauensis ZFHKF-1 TaxID=1196324 RepID=I8UI24_9BACL|nr:NAD(P)-binding protein [Fictibacillus macauensis]EIT86458.1 siroheme synthase [Fictibacillus macauensis ZFHKF-1]